METKKSSVVDSVVQNFEKKHSGTSSVHGNKMKLKYFVSANADVAIKTVVFGFEFIRTVS